jgi:hypothetical protein
MTPGEPFFSPTHRAAPPPKRPRERLFEFVRADGLRALQQRRVRMGGADPRGELFDAKGGYRTRDEAITWANAERRGLEG